MKKFAVKRGILLASAAALAVSGGVSGASSGDEAQPRMSLLTEYLQEGYQQDEHPREEHTAEPAGGLPRTAWKDIEAFQLLRTTAGRPLEPAVSRLSCPEPTACRQQFGDEVVSWTAAGGAVALHKSVDALSRQSSFSGLGRPVNSEYAFGTAYRTDFAHGSLIRVPELGRVMTWDPEISG